MKNVCCDKVNRNQVVEILRLVCCENLYVREEFISDAFIYSEPV